MYFLHNLYIILFIPLHCVLDFHNHCVLRDLFFDDVMKLVTSLLILSVTCDHGPSGWLMFKYFLYYLFVGKKKEVC